MSERDIKVQAIINPISGVGSKRKIPKMIEGICSKKNCSLNISFTEYAGHASELTRQAIEEGAEYILAVGGDGTVNEIARAMIHSNAILGIIPKGHVTTIDCCRANGQVFFCTCGVGFDAAVSQKFANEKRRGSLTYIKNTIEEYLSYKPEPYELVVDNQTIKEKAFLVACANASQYGNNAFIAPHANIQDGRMDVTILSPFMPLDIAPLAIQLFTKQIDRNSKIKTMKAQQVTIIRQHPGVMHLDGEPIMADRRIDITVEPKALHVLTPEVVSYIFKYKSLAIAVNSSLYRCRSISRVR